MKLRNHDEWKVGEAKQSLSQLLDCAREQPQKIFNRDRFVAAVISAEQFEEFERWLARKSQSLDSAFGEVREIAAEVDYRLEVPERLDRESWISDGSAPSAEGE